MEAATKAFVSYVRAYKEHHCKFIFRLQVAKEMCSQRVGFHGLTLVIWHFTLLARPHTCRTLSLVSWQQPLHYCACLACQRSSEEAMGSRVLLLLLSTRTQASP